MSAQGHTRSATVGQAARSPSAGDASRGGAASTAERVGNSGMAERMGLRAGAAEKESAATTMQRFAWMGEDDAVRGKDPVEPDPFSLLFLYKDPPARLRKAMAAFEARMRAEDEDAWRKWQQTEWRSTASTLSNMLNKDLPTHARQSGAQNRSNRSDWLQNVLELLEGNELFTYRQVMEREHVTFTENQQVGWEPTSAEARNVGRGNVSTSTGGLHSPVYAKEAPISIETAIERFNETDIPFKQGTNPDVGSVAEFEQFAMENSEIQDEAVARALLGPVASTLRKNRSIRIRLIGRSDYDFRGARVEIPEPGKIMGLERARSVRALLLKMGVKANQMTVEGEQIDDKDERRLGVRIEMF